jgi:hypothetical protein
LLWGLAFKTGLQVLPSKFVDAVYWKRILREMGLLLVPRVQDLWYGGRL